MLFFFDLTFFSNFDKWDLIDAIRSFVCLFTTSGEIAFPHESEISNYIHRKRKMFVKFILVEQTNK